MILYPPSTILNEWLGWGLTGGAVPRWDRHPTSSGGERSGETWSFQQGQLQIWFHLHSIPYKLIFFWYLNLKYIAFYRNLFSDGFPSEFSLSVTLKLASVTRRESWNLIDITNPQGETDFAVRFVGELRQIHLLYRDKVLNTLTTVEFDKKDTRNVSKHEGHTCS